MKKDVKKSKLLFIKGTVTELSKLEKQSLMGGGTGDDDTGSLSSKICSIIEK
ncbi:hypothetical protein [Flavobacterium columnare]|uniref:hypothetical protein n=1 Tax=Flavobacterium columnare TaxID=996 RepID=UPI0013E37934|nr:hypothetical protein [Flavobacterium columnare]